MTGDTANASRIISPYTAHVADGTQATGSYVAPSSVTQATPSISVDTTTGLITASATQSAGLVAAGTKSATEQLSTQAGTTITPTESQQTAVAANKYTLGAVKVGAISSTYVGSGITQRDSTDLTASGATVTAPAGYYASSASKSVASGSATTPATTVTADPSISVNSSTGLITATASATKSVTPTVSAGYVSSGTAGTITVSGSNTSQLSTQAGKTVSPTESEQTAVAAGKYTTGAVKVGAISSTYVGSGITQRDSTDLTASGATVTAPAGYYAESASKTVASGSATTPATTITANPSISVSSGGLITASASATKSVTPTVSAGYVSSGTAGTITVSGSNTSQLTTQAAQTITPTTTDQTIASGVYLTGAQTILGDQNLVAGNIKQGISIFNVQGSLVPSSYTLLSTQDVTISTTSTSATWKAAAYLNSSYFSDAQIIYVKIRDNAGPRNGYFIGSDCYFFNYQAASGSTSAVDQAIKMIHRKTSAGAFMSYGAGTTIGYGVFASYFANTGQIDIYSRYNSTYSLTINGSYNIQVFALSYAPYSGDPYDYVVDTHGTGVLTNRIEDGNFANTTWWGKYNCNLSVYQNVGTTYATSNIAQYPQLQKDGYTTTPGHTYYIRADVKYSASPTPPQNCELSLQNSDYSEKIYDSNYTNYGDWQTLSAYGTYNSTNGTIRLTLPMTANNTGYDSLNVYWRNAMFIDLTEGYDYGNEPTKAWCDANLSYFQGTYTIPT